MPQQQPSSIHESARHDREVTILCTVLFSRLAAPAHLVHSSAAEFGLIIREILGHAMLEAPVVAAACKWKFPLNGDPYTIPPKD